jgi:hypothetical protein
MVARRLRILLEEIVACQLVRMHAEEMDSVAGIEICADQRAVSGAADKVSAPVPPDMAWLEQLQA